MACNSDSINVLHLHGFDSSILPQHSKEEIGRWRHAEKPDSKNQWEIGFQSRKTSQRVRPNGRATSFWRIALSNLPSSLNSSTGMEGFDTVNWKEFGLWYKPTGQTMKKLD